MKVDQGMVAAWPPLFVRVWLGYKFKVPQVAEIFVALVVVVVPIPAPA